MRFIFVRWFIYFGLVFFCRYLRACLNVLAVSAVLGVIILVPIYQGGEEDMGDLPATTASNLSNGSPELWAMLVMGYVFTCVVPHAPSVFWS